MTTQTKNTTAAERRIARRQQLAEALNTAAVAVERLGARGDFMREAATELLIGNTEIVLGQQWAVEFTSAGSLSTAGPGGGGSGGVTVKVGEPPHWGQRDTREPLKTGADGRLEPVAKPQAERLVRWIVALPGGSNAWCSCPEHAEEYKKSQPGARIAQMVEATVDDAMIDRALDGWDQWWNGYPLPMNEEARRQAMKFTLEQALKVRA